MKTERKAGSTGDGGAGWAGQRRRGVALLLVMISLVVCSILMAGFLSSQGTGIGIARNEQKAEAARGLAQAGVDLCSWLIRNRSDWRTAMTPGAWLNNYAIGGGSVTVTAAEVDGAGSFATDTTKAVVLTAVGSYGSRTFTLTATIGPTGGGTVFRGGNYTKGQIILGVNDGLGNSSNYAFIDSYNSSIGSYGITHGSNAVFGNSYTGSGALMVYGNSDYNGSFVAGSKANLGNAVYATLWWNGPNSVSQATQPYTLGTVEIPNEAGLAYQGNLNHSTGNYAPTPGSYDSISLSSASGYTWTWAKFNGSGIYHITGNVSLQSYTYLQVPSGVSAVLIVDGNVALSGNSYIQLQGSGTLTMYVAGNVSMQSSAAINSSGASSAFTLLGTKNQNIQLQNSASMVGSVYAPAAAVSMQNTSVMYGAIISNNLSMQDSAAFHYDQALTSKRIDNITGGSAPAGTADYAYKIVGTSAVVAH